MFKRSSHQFGPNRCITTGLPTLVLIALTLAVGIVGCSRIQLAYNTADFSIELYASRYLGLDNRQIAAWRPILATALDQHRQEEVPAINTLLAQAIGDVNTGLTEAKVATWLDQIESLYQRHARLFAATTAPLLVELTPDQIDILHQKFLEQTREDATNNEPATLAHRREKRAERYAANVEWLTGELTPSQTALIAAETANFPDTAVSWFAYRDQQRMALLALLRRNPDVEQVGAFLSHWLADFQGLPADLAQARSQLRAGLIQLAVKVDATLSVEQRQHFAQRLILLREDLTSLQRSTTARQPGV